MPIVPELLIVVATVHSHIGGHDVLWHQSHDLRVLLLLLGQRMFLLVSLVWHKGSYLPMFLIMGVFIVTAFARSLIRKVKEHMLYISTEASNF